MLCFSYSLSAGNFSADSVLLDAYLREDMSVWREYLEGVQNTDRCVDRIQTDLVYEYGFCGYMVDREKEKALPYVKRFKQHIEAQKANLPTGHYEMYLSAVYVYEYKLRASFHVVKAMSLAKEATRLAPNDPLVSSYYGTCLFYAPKPIGSKQEALEWFSKAQALFAGEEWRYCWVREATEMYIVQCKEKLSMR